MLSAFLTTPWSSSSRFGGERWQTIVLTLRPLILDRHIAPHDKARVIQSLVESGNSSCEQLTRGKPEQNVSDL